MRWIEMDEELKRELSRDEQEIVELVERAVEGFANIEDWEFEGETLRLFSDLNLYFTIDFAGGNLHLYSESNYGISVPQGDTVEELANWFREYAEQIEKENRRMIELGFIPGEVEHDNVYNIFCLYSKTYPFKQLNDLKEDLKKLSSLWEELDKDWKRLYPEYQYLENQEDYLCEDEMRLKELVEQLEDPDRQTQLNALIAIGDYAIDGFTTESALPKLIKLLDHQDEEIRVQAAYVLGDYATGGLTVDTAPPKLEKLLDEENEKVRGGAAYALATYAHQGLTIKSALLKLAKLYKECESEETRDYAAYALDEYDEKGLKLK